MPNTVRYGSTGADALLCQKCLKNAGYYPYKLDGKFGTYSVGSVLKRTGLKGFQLKTGHTPDGVCGPKTWADLLKYKPKDPTPAPAPAPAPVVGPIQAAIQNKFGAFNTFSQFYNKMIGRGYSHYMNDVKTLQQEINTLAALNCVDSTQLGVLLAREMGYQARFVHVKCVKSGEGHIYGEIMGKEFGTNSYTKFDLAAAMSVNSRYPIGRVWCQDAKPVSYNDPWLESDDGRT